MPLPIEHSLGVVWLQLKECSALMPNLHFQASKVANPKKPAKLENNGCRLNKWLVNDMRTGKLQIKFRFPGLILWLLHLCCLLGIMVMQKENSAVYTFM